MTPVTAATDAGSTGTAQWTTCADCGLTQLVPPPRGHWLRACARCDASFGAGVADYDGWLALSLAALLLFIVLNALPLLGIYAQGHHNEVKLLASARGLMRQNNAIMGCFVLGLTAVMPLAHLLLQSHVLLCLAKGRRHIHLARVFLWSERVRPWAMLDVFMLAVFITISKLRDMSQVEILPGLWILGWLIAVFVMFGLSIDRLLIWDGILPPPENAAPRRAGWIICLACDYPHAPDDYAPGMPCARCDTPLHRRKPDSLQRTWALVAAASILYIPANLYPVMTVITLGREHPTTIMEGVRQLWNGSDWPYAFLVFAASIVIPLIKLVGLTLCLLAVHMRRQRGLVYRTRLYRLFDKIGRWSALDVFVAALLGALVDFGNLASIVPGPGLLPFAAVVVLTMLAVESFDPRLMWDSAGLNDTGKQHE